MFVTEKYYYRIRLHNWTYLGVHQIFHFAQLDQTFWWYFLSIEEHRTHYVTAITCIPCDPIKSDILKIHHDYVILSFSEPPFCTRDQIYSGSVCIRDHIHLKGDNNPIFSKRWFTQICYETCILSRVDFHHFLCVIILCELLEPLLSITTPCLGLTADFHSVELPELTEFLQNKKRLSDVTFSSNLKGYFLS